MATKKKQPKGDAKSQATTRAYLKKRENRKPPERKPKAERVVKDLPPPTIKVLARGTKVYAGTSRGILVNHLPDFKDHDTAVAVADYIANQYEREGHEVEMYEHEVEGARLPA